MDAGRLRYNSKNHMPLQCAEKKRIKKQNIFEKKNERMNARQKHRLLRTKGHNVALSIVEGL